MIIEIHSVRNYVNKTRVAADKKCFKISHPDLFSWNLYFVSLPRKKSLQSIQSMLLFSMFSIFFFQEVKNCICSKFWFEFLVLVSDMSLYFRPWNLLAIVSFQQKSFWQKNSEPFLNVYNVCRLYLWQGTHMKNLKITHSDCL